MAMHSFGGIDVSKDRLDVMVLPEEQCSSVPKGLQNIAGERSSTIVFPLPMDFLSRLRGA